jgi:SAM-dependent methyltransferase
VKGGERQPAPRYVLGHSSHELSRLAQQGAFFADITRRALQRAGVRRGMRVLDIGCGAGDVSLLAAELVGGRGHVLGIDRVPAAVRAAARRASRSGVGHVTFRVADVDTLALDAPVDAVIGRFVLMHQPQPAAAVVKAIQHLRHGGVVAMIESHIRGSVRAVHSWPRSATYDRIMRWMMAVIDASGAHSDMGLRLRQTFLDAGLPEPSLAMDARVEGGRDAPILRYTIDSVRSLMPAAERAGITSLRTSELPALEARLGDEAASPGTVFTSPLIVSASCRLVRRA